MAINIKPHPYRIVCDMCGSRDTFIIDRQGTPVHQQPTLCKDDIIGIVNAGMEYFKDEIRLPLADDYEQLKTEIAHLNTELEAGSTEINRLNVELEASSTEINRLTVALRAAKQKVTSGSKTTTAKKGGKKK